MNLIIKRLIVNADDYGHTKGASKGIRRAHLNGIVSSTSVMMNRPAALTELDQNKLPFWSGSLDHCTVPGCESVTISTYATGNNPVRQNVITYTYDGLNQLTAADYDFGNIFEYTYDAVGNRLNETRKPNSTMPEVVTVLSIYLLRGQE